MIDIALCDYFAPLQNLANYVAELPTSIQLRESQYVMPWVFVLHVISMCMFAGTILMMDLRLLGVGYMQTPFSQVQRRLFPWQMVAMFISSATGLALVWGNPLNYVTNIIFWLNYDNPSAARAYLAERRKRDPQMNRKFYNASYPGWIEAQKNCTWL